MISETFQVKGQYFGELAELILDFNLRYLLALIASIILRDVQSLLFQEVQETFLDRLLKRQAEGHDWVERS